MKILIDARMYGLENSGIGRYLINLTEELKNPSTSLRTSLKNIEFVILLRKKYFDILNFPKNWIKVLADFRHYTFEEQLKLPSIIKKENPDLVHFPHINYPVFFRGKHVITVHDLTMQRQGVDATTLPLPYYYLKRIPFLFSAKLGIKSAIAIITPSNQVKNEVSKYYNINSNKIFVTYEGVSQGFERKRGDSGELEILSKFNLVSGEYFFYVGNAYPHKNLGLVVKAIVTLNQKLNSIFKFAIAGSRGVFVERIQNLVKKEGADDFVKILGYISDDTLQIFYKHSIAFVYPSFSEGFGLQGLEAIASGSLVLASDIPVFKEIYEDNVFYFDPHSVESLVNTMESVIKMSPHYKASIINNAKEFIKVYSWSKMAKQTLKIYEDSIGLRSGK